jgi:predicted N-acetyltransferase YhbS
MRRTLPSLSQRRGAPDFLARPMPAEDTASLASRIERGQAEAMVELAVDARPVAGGWMTCGGPGDFVNKACGLGLEGPVSAGAAEDIVDFFQSRSVEPQVELCPFVHPSLLAALANAGFQLREFENVLFRPLPGGEDFRQALPQGWPAGLEVTRVDPADARAVEEYVRLSTQGFFSEGREMSEGFRASALKAPRLPHSDSFVARLDGQSIGAGGCASRAGLTALFGTSVLSEFRGRGVQQALIATRLARAVERGSPAATIVSHPRGATERNAARLGFRMAYTRAVLVRPGPALSSSP